MTTNKTGHVPERMCVICRQRMPWNMLTRHVAVPQADGKTVLQPDAGKKQPGRGIYVCSGEKCQIAFARKYSCGHSGLKG